MGLQNEKHFILKKRVKLPNQYPGFLAFFLNSTPNEMQPVLQPEIKSFL